MVDYAPGALTKVSIDGTPMAVLSTTVGKTERLLVRDGLRGLRSRFDTAVRKGPQMIGGSISMEPSHAELVALMALAIGTGGNCADTIPEFDVVIDRETQIDTYADCKVSRATIAGTQGGIISCDLEIVGKTETEATGTVATPESDIPYILADMTLTLAAASRETHSFSLVIDNHIDTERFLLGLTMPHVVELDRTVTLTSTHPYNTTNLDLYDQAVGGAAGTLALNNSVNTCSFAFGRLQVPAESAEVPGKSEVMMTLNMLAHKVNASAAGTTDEIQFSST